MNEVTVVIPWSSKLSKNARLSHGPRSKRPFVVKEVRELQDSLRQRFADAPGTWHQAKVWISMFVQMPSARSDAINILDTVADAVKKGIGVDDRWFSIEYIDWELQRDDPKVTITVKQSAVADEKPCSNCKRLLPRTGEFFHASSKASSGLQGRCKECSSESTKQRYWRNKVER